MTIHTYLDIETTGLSAQQSELTVIGLARYSDTSHRVHQLVGHGITIERLNRALLGTTHLYTYNGSRFDLPFIRAHLNVDLAKQFTHRDLMYDCWRQQLKGGLKVVEKKLGIQRQLPDINGAMAVRLWWQYIKNNDQEALETLLAYNREDVVNLHTLRGHLDGLFA